jgi:subtilisin-like proprotein convertase family protein
MRPFALLHSSRLGARLALLGGLVLAATPASAAVPNASVLEATLNSTGGGPAADGNYAITFAIYKDATDPTALWSEGPVQIAVKNGQFSYVLGSTTPLKPSLLSAGAFLTFKVGTDPELPRKAVNASLFSLRAAVAESIDCSGCIPATALEAQALNAFAKKSDLAGVALSGNYSDLSGLPTLTAYAKAVDLAKSATTGSFTDLKDLPTLPLIGKSCGTGLVLAGFKADGSLDCVQGGSAGSLPPDGIDEISNNLIFNQFTDVIASPKQPIDIPDNNPIGASDTIVVPDIGTAQKLSVSLTLVNSDISKVKIYLYDPNNTEYVLYDKSGKTGDGIITSYPDNTKPVSGDLTTWVGKNPKGNWIIKVVDSSFFNNVNDGQIQKWSVTIQTLSNKKIQVKGDLIVDGNLTVNGNNPTASQTTYRYNVISMKDSSWNWYMGNATDYTLGVNPSNWSNGNYTANNVTSDKSFWRMVFDKPARNRVGGSIWTEFYDNGCDSDIARYIFVLFRVKNTTGATINWTPTFYYTSYSGWAERSSATLNGANTWAPSDNCYMGNCSANPTFAIPANRTSSIIFAIGSGPLWQPSYQCQRGLSLTFTKGSLTLPTGLDYVDDLDTATGGWEQ